MNKKMMVIPIFDTVVLPFVRYQFGSFSLSDQEKHSLMKKEDLAILLPLRRMVEWPEIKAEDFYDIGLIAKIHDVSELLILTRLDAETGDKVRITGLEVGEGIIMAEYEVIREKMDVTEQGEEALRDSLLKMAEEVSVHFKGGDMALSTLKNCKTSNEMISMFGQFLGMSPEEKFELLRLNSFRRRAALIADTVARFKTTVELQADLSRKYDDTQNGTYREAAIRRQMEILQDELESIRPEEVDEDSFEYKIETCGMPAEVKSAVLKDLKKFRQKQPSDPEYSTLYDYLDFVTGLAWTAEPQGTVDLAKARQIMDRDHYGLDKVKERILQQLAVMSLTGKQDGSILLLVGAPGTGKTSMGKSIAEALGRKYVRISLGGVHDEAEIRGHRRTYIGAMPGRIMDGIAKSGVKNPVVVLDEVDKLGASFHGDPSSALLEVLDPEQNNTFTDHYMNIPYDLSQVFFLCTANTFDTVPQPLLDRMEVISLPGYTPVEKFHIGKKHLIKKSLADTGLKAGQLRVTDNAMKKIIADYTMESGVRGLKKQLDILCRKTAARIVGEGKTRVTVKEKDLTEYLGTQKLHHDRVPKKAVPGVVTGLAWTQAGGEILFIETTSMAGKGEIQVTGQLGDVMKESASIAVSLVKARFVDNHLDLNEKDIHIHVPAGAVPKDGPSAGVTMFTALTSLVTGIPVDPELAMTGEISLQGRVMPIGGLPEKLMAAERAGVKKVLIPKENEVDLEEVPAETKDKLEIVCVSTVDEVIGHALHLRLPALHSPILFDGKLPAAKGTVVIPRT